MKLTFNLLVVALLLSPAVFGQYAAPKPGLIETPYQELPLGAIKPKGWLLEMLVRQKDGSTGSMDKQYPLVMGSRNGWLGGDGDQWERGPYWVDGLLPLAYILQDKALIAKVKPWIEWSIKSQTPDGYFGPSKDYPGENGVQRDNARDWWPKMVMLKILKQYYSATGDKRVITLMTNYFKYQLNELPTKPLDHWTYWAKFRAGDNLAIVYWLYNKTGDQFFWNQCIVNLSKQPIRYHFRNLHGYPGRFRYGGLVGRTVSPAQRKCRTDLCFDKKYHSQHGPGSGYRRA